MFNLAVLRRYRTLTLPEDRAANGLFVNGTLVHRSKAEAPKSDPVRSIGVVTLSYDVISTVIFQVFSAKIDFPRQPVAISELSKTSLQRPLSSLFIMVRKTKHVRRL